MRIIAPGEYDLLCALLTFLPDEASLVELAQKIETAPASVGFLLDGLVEEMGVLKATPSFEQSAIGTMMYGWSDAPHAQTLYQLILERNPHLRKKEKRSYGTSDE